jgi:adenylate cyclase
MARFSIRHPDGTESTYELTKAETRIGRVAPLVDLTLPDSMASRIHAVVRRTQSGYAIVDLRSANHTYVNGETVTERRLRDGDVVRIGQTTLVFEPSRTAATVEQTDQPMPSQGTVMLAKPGTLTVDPVSALATPEEIARLRKKAATLARLFELSKTLATVFDLEKIFEHVAGLMFKETPADCAVVFLAEPGGELTPVRTNYRTKGGSSSQSISVSRTILRRAVDERVSVLVCDDTPNADRSSTMLLQNIHSAICAPLLGSTGVLGAIYVDRRAPLNALSADDLDLINAVAGQLAVAIEKTQSANELARAEVARASYQRFLPAHVVEQILEAPDRLKLGGVTQVVTVVFADICSFTPIAERVHPEKVVEMLNRLFTVLTEIIFEHGGTLDKYIGDAIMALFGAPYVGEDDARNAVNAAIAMRRALPAINEEFASLDLPRVRLAIGINTGPATVGYIGSDRSMDYTAIGDTVNLAARLQTSAKPGQILVSEATARAVNDATILRPLDKIKVKGRESAVSTYEVILGRESAASTGQVPTEKG